MVGKQMSVKRVCHSDIISHLAERHTKQQIEIVDRFPSLLEVKDNVMLGSFSWYWMNSKRKDILRPFAMNFTETISTPSELARAYLELKYPKQRATGEQLREFEKPRSAPLFSKPQTLEEGVYIDIRSAYWQILQIVGWDADYNPQKWLARGEPMDDFPYADIKLSRNCLITAGLPSEASFWHGQDAKFKKVNTHNRSSNLGIWALTMDILHGVAWDAIQAGAIYAHTDGFICHAKRYDAVVSAIREWGLESRVKMAGETKVYGVGCYQIGEHGTKNPKIQDHHYDGLRLPSKISPL